MSDDHDFEPAYGLPECLPPSERLIWQGSPDWRRMARDAVHIRELAVYFAVLLAWRGANAASDGKGLHEVLVSVMWLAPLAVMALGMLALLAWLMARTSVYTITDRRVVMRIGIVLTVTFNLPFKRIVNASLHAHADGSGDIALGLAGPDRIAYAHLWPHVRPWKLARTEPMLRALPDARAVAVLLSAALAESAGQSRPAVPAAAEPRDHHGAAPEALTT
jgi:hypothetical protein